MVQTHLGVIVQSGATPNSRHFSFKEFGGASSVCAVIKCLYCEKVFVPWKMKVINSLVL